MGPFAAEAQFTDPGRDLEPLRVRDLNFAARDSKLGLLPGIGDKKDQAQTRIRAENAPPRKIHPSDE